MNDDREYWNALAIIVIAGLLLYGCSLILDAVDKYREWRGSHINAPNAPAVCIAAIQAALRKRANIKKGSEK